MSNLRKTKIHCTIGPSCDSVEILCEMIKAGMDVARVNLSHGSAESQADKLTAFRKACELCGTDAPKMMFDIRGPEVRVKELPGGEVEIVAGDTVVLRCEEVETESSVMKTGITDDKGRTVLTVNYDALGNEVEVGTEILIDDGKIRLEVLEIKGSDIVCRVAIGGVVKTRKGVNVPDVRLQMDYLGDDDKEDILWCIANGVDYVAGSFIRREDDVRLLRDFLDANGGENIAVIAKLENKEAITNLEAIAAASDQILVARGDMGVEIGFERVPGVQKRLIRRCTELGKPVIVATQVIESMTDSMTPTRAEVSDVANAVYDGATDIMVTGETASGKYPVEVVKELVRIIEQAELDLSRYGSEIL